MAGVPSSVQTVQKTGLPVLSSPIGASPEAGGVKSASKRSRSGADRLAQPGLGLDCCQVVDRSNLSTTGHHASQRIAQATRTLVVLPAEQISELGPGQAPVHLDGLVERLGELDGRQAELGRQAGEALLRRRFRSIPARTCDEGESRCSFRTLT